MRPSLRRAAALAMMIANVAACGSAVPAVDPDLAVSGDPMIDGPIYPGQEVGCQDDCDDLTGAVRLWIGRDLAGAELWSVTWHAMVAEDGQPVVIHSSGGIYIAVATLTDGSRVALFVGCGVGAGVERCFPRR